MMRRVTLSIWILSLWSLTLAGQNSRKELLKADKAYKSGKYHEAELQYRKAKELHDDYATSLNIGNAFFHQENYEEAITAFESSIALAKSDLTLSDAYYNLGNTYLKMDDPEQAIGAYKEAIKKNRTNIDIRTNLLMAQLMRDIQEAERPPEEQQQQQQDGQEGDPQDGDQDQQSQQDSTQQQQQPQDPDQESAQDSTQQQQAQDSLSQAQSAIDSTLLDKQSLDSLEAMQLLEVIQNKEQQIQEKLRKFNANRRKPDKDW